MPASSAYSQIQAEGIPRAACLLSHLGSADDDQFQTADPEVALSQKANRKMKDLIQKLGEAIHQSVADSEDIAGVVKSIRDQGFDVLLMLEATIGLNEVDAAEAETVAATDPASEPAVGPFTHHDLSFLKSLRITLNEEEEAPEKT